MAVPVIIDTKLGVHTVFGESGLVAGNNNVVIRCEDPYLVRWVEYVRSRAGAPVAPGPEIIDYFVYAKSAAGALFFIDGFDLVTGVGGVKGVEFTLYNLGVNQSDYIVKLRWPHSMEW